MLNHEEMNLGSKRKLILIYLFFFLLEANLCHPSSRSTITATSTIWLKRNAGTKSKGRGEAAEEGGMEEEEEEKHHWSQHCPGQPHNNCFPRHREFQFLR
jgi:hypothetical protein